MATGTRKMARRQDCGRFWRAVIRTAARNTAKELGLDLVRGPGGGGRASAGQGGVFHGQGGPALGRDGMRAVRRRQGRQFGGAGSRRRVDWVGWVGGGGAMAREKSGRAGKEAEEEKGEKEGQNATEENGGGGWVRAATRAEMGGVGGWRRVVDGEMRIPRGCFEDTAHAGRPRRDAKPFTAGIRAAHDAFQGFHGRWNFCSA